ncbi:hypothetical protein [Acidianus brierleyi]|uniref:hypothetical protein n=1 Tax=Acidianus brierleyi TaxID=41673 RepID=UPI001FE6123E|nr:hypothetical protein [Acidianus brierleyi]
MKVLKYHLKAKIQIKDKEETKELTFRHLINVRKFINGMSKKYDVKCSKLNSSGDVYTTQCEGGDSTKLFFEVKKERIKKPKAEKKEEKKEAKKEKKEAENREYQVESKPEPASETKRDTEMAQEKKEKQEETKKENS